MGVTVEYIVGGKVDHQSVVLKSPASEEVWQLAVDPGCKVLLLFGPIYLRISGSVDDNLGACPIEQRQYLAAVREIRCDALAAVTAGATEFEPPRQLSST